MSMTNVELPGGFGVQVIGVDLSRDRSSAVCRHLVETLYRRQFVVIKGQRLALAEFDAVTQAFGVQRPHLLDHLRMDGHAAILMLSNIYDSGRQLGIYEGACFWHTDVAYEDPPNSATIVYAISVPAEPAPTDLADMYSAYDGLPDRTKRLIDDLIVIHHYGNRDDTREGSPTAAERLTEMQKRRVHDVHHPLVIRHPVTGRRALYGIAGSSFGIVGMPLDEAVALLRELQQHATQAKYTMAYNYDPGDIACWDTYATLHRAPAQRAAKPGDPHARLLWRVSVTGTSRLVPLHVDRAGDSARRPAAIGSSHACV